MTVTTPVARVLTAADRCDRCGAQAYHVTQHVNGELLWCQHHFREFQTKLKPKEVTA